jgi:hypothetical protein
MFENPVTELKRRENPKRPLPLLFLPEWPQYFLKRSKGKSKNGGPENVNLGGAATLPLIL